MNTYVILLNNLGRREEAGEWALRSMDAHLRVLKFKHPMTQRAIRWPSGRGPATMRPKRSSKIIDPARTGPYASSAPTTKGPSHSWAVRIPLLYGWGHLSEAASAAEELVEAYSRTLGHEAGRR